MRNIFITGLFATTAIFNSSTAQCQTERSGSYSYAVTDSVREGVKWNYLRTLDLRTGAYGDMLLQLLHDADMLPGNLLCNGVAAIAHDKKNKRLYFAPMLTDRLSYVDLKTMRTHIVTNSFTGLGPKEPDQSDIVTRMVIADDDYGYALTNDGKHLLRFSTGRHHIITDRGTLINAHGNEVSVHETCGSFGGDLVSDDEGNLYLITVRNNVFKIDIRTRRAKYLGSVSGLPSGFSTSGAAVDHHSNRIVIVSSVDASDVYEFNIRNLEARRVRAHNPWRASDLANSNILRDSRHHYDREIIVDENDKSNEDAGADDNDKVLIYPNPVTGNEFKIQFINPGTGRYTIEVIDARGQVITTKAINTTGKNSVVSINLPELTGKGIFVVRIMDKNNSPFYKGKIVLQ